MALLVLINYTRLGGVMCVGECGCRLHTKSSLFPINLVGRDVVKELPHIRISFGLPSLVHERRSLILVYHALQHLFLLLASDEFHQTDRDWVDEVLDDTPESSKDPGAVDDVHPLKPVGPMVPQVAHKPGDEERRRGVLHGVTIVIVEVEDLRHLPVCLALGRGEGTLEHVYVALDERLLVPLGLMPWVVEEQRLAFPAVAAYHRPLRLVPPLESRANRGVGVTVSIIPVEASPDVVNLHNTSVLYRAADL